MEFFGMKQWFRETRASARKHNLALSIICWNFFITFIYLNVHGTCNITSTNLGACKYVLHYRKIN